MADELDVIVGEETITVTVPEEDLVVTVDEDGDFEILQSTEDDFEITLQTVSSSALTIALYARLAVYATNEPANSEVILRYVVTDDLSLPADLEGSRGSALTAATAEAVFSIKKNGSEVGTATFAAASGTAVFAGAGATLQAGDIVTIEAPAVQDTTLANIALTLAINRVV